MQKKHGKLSNISFFSETLIDLGITINIALVLCEFCIEIPQLFQT